MNSCEKDIEQSHGKTLVRCFKHKTSTWHRQLTSLNKKWSFPLRIFPVNVIKSAADLVTFAGEILNGKLHFLCSGCIECRATLYIHLRIPEVSPDIVFVPTKRQKAVFYTYVLPLLKQLFCLIKHLMDKTSTKERYSCMNTYAIWFHFMGLKIHLSFLFR